MDKERASHVYTAKGTFAVTLRISDDQGNEPVEDTVNAYVDVPPPPATPVAGIVMKPLTDEDRQSRTATISDASSNNGGSPLTQWKLDWGDGTPALTTKERPAAAKHQYSNDGPHTISLTVTNTDEKQSKPASVAVGFSVQTVLDVKPRQTEIGKPIEASATKAGTVDFAGESRETIAENGKVKWKGFSKPGVYRVAWSPADSLGIGEHIDVRVTKEPEVPEDPVVYASKLPIANLRLYPNPAKVGQPLEADTSASAAGSFDGRTTGKIVKREIRWSADDSFTLMDKGKGSHAYPTKGSYAVTLRITDDQGKSAEDIVKADVGATPPRPFDIIKSGTDDKAGGKIKFSLLVRDAKNPNSTDYEVVDWYINDSPFGKSGSRDITLERDKGEVLDVQVKIKYRTSDGNDVEIRLKSPVDVKVEEERTTKGGVEVGKTTVVP